jgi:hypothetical protein
MNHSIDLPYNESQWILGFEIKSFTVSLITIDTSSRPDENQYDMNSTNNADETR